MMFIASHCPGLQEDALKYERKREGGGREREREREEEGERKRKGRTEKEKSYYSYNIIGLVYQPLKTLTTLHLM